MLIRSEANNASIELSEKEGLTVRAGSEYYPVTLREHEFEVSSRAYAFDPKADGLAKFFLGLDRDWTGWEGIRTWYSLEGEFELICEHDRIGHVTITATLGSNAGGHGWMGQIHFDLAAGELDRVAADVPRFFKITA
jgi:hypothetical protein